MAVAAEAAQIKTPIAIRKQDIAKIAEKNDRFEILEKILPRVPVGTIWFSDTMKIGAANVDKCEIPLSTWVQAMKVCPEDGRCKGLFLSSFGRNHSSRRCERATKGELCKVCLSMFSIAKMGKKKCVSVKEQSSYEVITKAMFSRPGVIANMAYWDKKSNEIKKEKKLEKEYPYFTANEIIEMVLLESSVVFKDGGKGGRTYSRSAAIIEAQDEFVRVCLKCILTILRFEQKQHFMKRWKTVSKMAVKIHEQMMEKASELDRQVGAIQAADVIREELSRAAEWSEREHQTARHLSLRSKRLGDWAQGRKKPSSPGSSESVSSTSPTRIPSSNPSANGKPLEFTRIGKKRKIDDDRLFDPKHKKFIIKQSTRKGAGKGLFLLEPAKDGEQIFRYSGKVIDKEQAMKSESKYIVKISDRVYLDGQGEDEWEGKMANCARKAGRKANARISAATRYNICPKTSKCWVPIFAVGDLQPQEIWIDYGDMYWPSDDEKSPIQSPETSSSKSEDESDRASDSDYSLPKSSKIRQPYTPRRSKRIEEVTKAKEESKQSSHSNEPEQKKPQTTKSQMTESQRLESSEPSSDEKDEMGYGEQDQLNHNALSPVKSSDTYAVMVGRCVGIFKSAARVYSVTNRFPNRAVKKFESTKQAEDFMKQAGFVKPIHYWKSEFASGSLMEAPQSALGKKVCFPAGLKDYDGRGWGTIVKTGIESDSRVWTVALPNGFHDTMSEWPLLCGIDQYEQVFGRKIKKIFAIRGSERDGILTDEAMIPSRLVGVHAEVQQFDSESEARRWISQAVKHTYFAIRGGLRDGVTTDSAEVPLRMTSESAEFEEFESMQQAEAWVQARQFFAVKDAKGVSNVMQLQEFLKQAKGRKGWSVSGPHSKARAVEISDEWSKTRARREHSMVKEQNSVVVDLAGDTCIARMSDGSECGRKHNVSMTKIGPLCGEHVYIMRGVGSDSFRKSKPMQSYPEKERSMETTSIAVSPEEGIQMPDKKKTIRRSKQNKVSVIAVRTFPDKQYSGNPAGSIWLSMDDAEEANSKGGDIKCFSAHSDIFENLAEAREWISDQEHRSSDDDDVEAEFDRLMQAARKNRQTSVSHMDNTISRDSRKGPSRKGTGRGHGRGRGGGRGGRGGSGMRKNKSWRKNKKEAYDEDDDDDNDESDENESEEDEEPFRGARGARFRRRQRQRGSRRDRRGGLRSGATVLLDKEQSRVEKQLFHEEAEMVLIYEFDVPQMQKCVKIPLPGKAGALTTSRDAKHVLSFGNNMEAVLAEKTFKSFKAFSLSELMEFQQLVHYVADYQPQERQDITDSVVEAVDVIAKNSIQTYASMRDADALGPHGQNFKAYTYLQVMYMVMFREAFEGALAEMFFWDYAQKFAIKAKGSAGMGPSKCHAVSESEPTVSMSERCLFCGKAGHRASASIHKNDIAEGSGAYSQENLKKALAEIAKDTKLTAELKKRWSGRIKAFWAKMQSGTEDLQSSSH